MRLLRHSVFLLFASTLSHFFRFLPSSSFLYHVTGSITNNQGARRRSVGIDLGIVDQDAGIHKISEMQEKAAVLSAQLRSQSLPGSDV